MVRKTYELKITYNYDADDLEEEVTITVPRTTGDLIDALSVEVGKIVDGFNKGADFRFIFREKGTRNWMFPTVWTIRTEQ